MKGIVGFDHLQITCIIGVHPEERVAPQQIFVDFKGEFDFTTCVKSDLIQDTLDYAEVAKLCTEVAMQRAYSLLETCAYDALHLLVQKYDLKWAWIKVKKPTPFANVEWTYVELVYGERK